jgi:hypothetical protein
MSPLPLYAEIANLIEQFATGIYRPWLTAPDGSRKEDELYTVWFRLRTIAGRIQCTNSVYLLPENWTELYAGIVLAHDLEHNADINGVPNITKCECPVASRTAELFLKIREYDRQLKGGSNAA